jgi:hypothetical protein
MTVGSTRPLTEMSTRNLPEVKRGWSVRLTSPPSVSRLSRKCRILNVWQPYERPLPVTGIPLPVTCLWSSSSWLHIQRPRLDSRRYKIFWEVVRLELGPLSLVSTTEELLGRESSCSSLERGEYGRRGPLYPQMLTLTSPTSGGRSVGIVRCRTQATEFVFVV